MTDPFDHLARLKAQLDEGLALLDGAAPDDPAVPEALGRVATALRSGPDLAELRGAVPAERLGAFDDRLEELLRLNAVLARAVSADREALVSRLRNVRTSRRDLAYYGKGEGAAGGRCDMSA